MLFFVPVLRRSQTLKWLPLPEQSQNKRDKVMKNTVLTLLAIALGTTAYGQNSNYESGSTVVALGTADLDQGQPDRDYLSIQGNYFKTDGLGLHFDLSGLSSDLEDTAYGAVGLSQEIAPDLRAKLMLGGSNSTTGFYPKFHADGEIEKNFGSESGLILRGGLSYSKYDNDTEEARIRGNLARYAKPLTNGGYFVQQAGLSLSTSLGSGTTGWEASGAITYVDPNGWSAGLGVSAGRIAYDQQLGAAVENDFFAVRPAFGYQIGEKTEVFLRAEYVDTELYDLTGATIGLKFDLK